jgi:hypothetical protein
MSRRGNAPLHDSFVQYLPVDRQPPPTGYRTTLQIVAEEDALVIGVRAFDPRPDEIRAPLTRRDQVKRDQDFVAVLLGGWCGRPRAIGERPMPRRPSRRRARTHAPCRWCSSTAWASAAAWGWASRASASPGAVRSDELFVKAALVL